MSVEFLLLAISLLFFASIFFDRIGRKFGMPALLVFLLVGIIFGRDGLGLHFDSIEAAQAIGSIAMCVILFTGGLDTKFSSIRPVLAPGATLATIGVLLTCIITGFTIWGIYRPFGQISLALSLLLAATLSSTDSASVFSIMRSHGIRLKHRLGETIELESGANDPMAYVLVTTLIDICTSPTSETTALDIFQTMFIQMVMGLAIGIVAGYALIWILDHVQLTNQSLYPIMILSACIFIFSATHYMMGNSYLAVYVGGLIIGNYKFARKRQTRAFFDGLTWLSQLLMFLMLGLMVTPSDFLQMDVWLPSLVISLTLIFIARPLAVICSMQPFNKMYNGRDMLFVSWVGLKGAVPIIFAIQCQAAGVPLADTFFNVIFLCSLFSLAVQGLTVDKMANRLKLSTPAVKLKRLYHFDMDLPEEVESSATEMTVTAQMMQGGHQLKDLTLPHKTLVIMVNRKESYFVPTGVSEIQEGDILLMITDDASLLAAQQLELERQEDEENWQQQLIQHPKDFIRSKAHEFMDHETH